MPQRAERIRFESGATGITLYGFVQVDQPISYVLNAEEGQSISLLLQNRDNQARIDIQRADGTVLGVTRDGVIWNYVLPETGDYYITIHARDQNHRYTLWVEISP